MWMERLKFACRAYTLGQGVDALREVLAQADGATNSELEELADGLQNCLFVADEGTASRQ